MLSVSVVVTCLNEERTIGPCLESLLAQDYPAHALEIVVVDGGSRDSTRDVVARLAPPDGRIRLVVEPRKGTAAGRNAGIREALFDHVAFIDADCTAPAGWLRTLAEGLATARAGDPSVAGAGGRNLPPQGADDFVAAIGIALDSYPGSFGSVQGRQFAAPRLVESLATCNAIYEKRALDEAGGFDETLMSDAEDADLNHRLVLAGRRLLYLPDSLVWHAMRATPRGWLRNMFRYGRGRARLLKRHPAMRRPAYALPPLFLLAMAVVPLAPVWPPLALPLLYLPAVLALSVRLSRLKGRPELWAEVARVFLIQHFGYAAGEVYGLLSPRVR